MNVSTINNPISIALAKGKQPDENAIKLTKLKKACQDFEAIFIYYLLKTMRSASSSSTLFGKGMGAEIFMQMFDQGLSEKISTGGQLGIWQKLYDKYSDRVAVEPVTMEKQSIPSIFSQPIKTRQDEETIEPPNLSEVNISKPDAAQVAVEQAQYREFGIYEQIIKEAAAEHGIAPELIHSVMIQESGGDRMAVSPKGAKGLMQLMDSTAAMLGVTDPFDPRQNIFAGAKYLSMMLKKFGGDLKKTLAAYNAGPGAVLKYGGVPPYEQTRKYVSAVVSRLSGLFNSNDSR